MFGMLWENVYNVIIFVFKCFWIVFLNICVFDKNFWVFLIVLEKMVGENGF